LIVISDWSAAVSLLDTGQVVIQEAVPVEIIAGKRK
jgi:hypothetical protein